MTILFENLLQISVGAAILGLLVIGARAAIKSRHTVLVTVLYVMFIVKLIVPFSIESPLSVQNLIGIQSSAIVSQQAEHYNEVGDSFVTDVVNSEKESLNLASSDIQGAVKSSAPTLPDIAAIVWIAGVAILSLVLTVFNLCFIRKLRKNRLYNNPNFDALLSECKNAYNIHKGYPLFRQAISMQLLYTVFFDPSC